MSTILFSVFDKKFGGSVLYSHSDDSDVESLNRKKLTELTALIIADVGGINQNEITSDNSYRILLLNKYNLCSFVYFFNMKDSQNNDLFSTLIFLIEIHKKDSMYAFSHQLDRLFSDLSNTIIKFYPILVESPSMIKLNNSVIDFILDTKNKACALFDKESTNINPNLLPRIVSSNELKIESVAIMKYNFTLGKVDTVFFDDSLDYDISYFTIVIGNPVFIYNKQTINGEVILPVNFKTKNGNPVTIVFAYFISEANDKNSVYCIFLFCNDPSKISVYRWVSFLRDYTYYQLLSLIEKIDSSNDIKDVKDNLMQLKSNFFELVYNFLTKIGLSIDIDPLSLPIDFLKTIKNRDKLIYSILTQKNVLIIESTDDLLNRKVISLIKWLFKQNTLDESIITDDNIVNSKYKLPNQILLLKNTSVKTINLKEFKSSCCIIDLSNSKIEIETEAKIDYFIKKISKEIDDCKNIESIEPILTTEINKIFLLINDLIVLVHEQDRSKLEKKVDTIFLDKLEYYSIVKEVIGKMNPVFINFFSSLLELKVKRMLGI